MAPPLLSRNATRLAHSVRFRDGWSRRRHIPCRSRDGPVRTRHTFRAATAVDSASTPAIRTVTDAMVNPSASYSLTMRVTVPHTPGSFARVAAAVGEAGGMLGAIDLVRQSRGQSV